MNVYSEILQCCFDKWQAVEHDHLALILPKNNICDMNGAVKTAESIMPTVKTISVYQNEKFDVVYMLEDGKWSAYDLRQIK